MRANMEESGTKKVEIPAEDKDFAVSCPPYLALQIRFERGG